MNLFSTLPDRLLTLRETLSYTRQQLANLALGPRAAANNIGRIERGVHNAMPMTLDKIARALGVSLHFLTNGYAPFDARKEAYVDEAFPARMQSLMWERDLSLSDLVVCAKGVSFAMLFALRRGNLRPSKTVLAQLATAFNVSVSALATGEGLKSPVATTIFQRTFYKPTHTADSARQFMSEKSRQFLNKAQLLLSLASVSDQDVEALNRHLEALAN